MRQLDLEVVTAAVVTDLRAARLRIRCVDCGRVLGSEVGGFDLAEDRRWCVPCSVAADLLRGVAA